MAQRRPGIWHLTPSDGLQPIMLQIKAEVLHSFFGVFSHLLTEEQFMCSSVTFIYIVQPDKFVYE